MTITPTFEELLKIHNLALSHAEGAVDDEQDRYLRSLVPTGIYEHFKSTPQDRKYYAVEGVGRDVDDGPYRVCYRSLYGKHYGERAFRVLVGEEKGFLMPVDRPEIPYRGARFTPVQLCPEDELLRISEEY